jgi:thiamine phosphate synthase YjbQ (UPF0047 family)
MPSQTERFKGDRYTVSLRNPGMYFWVRQFIYLRIYLLILGLFKGNFLSRRVPRATEDIHNFLSRRVPRATEDFHNFLSRRVHRATENIHNFLSRRVPRATEDIHNFLSRHVPRGTKDIHKNTIHESWYPGRDSNRAHSEYKSTALPLQQPDR